MGNFINNLGIKKYLDYFVLKITYIFKLILYKILSIIDYLYYKNFKTIEDRDCYNTTIRTTYNF